MMKGEKADLVPRKNKKPKLDHGPLYVKFNDDKHDKIPYDYIVIIDAGSKGSRVYVYNWINPEYALKHNYNFQKPQLAKKMEVAERDKDKEEDPKKSKAAKYPVVGTKKKWHRKIKPGISSFNKSPQKIGKHHLRSLLQLASSVVPKSQHYRTPIFVHSTAGMRLLTPTEQQEILDSICSYINNNSDFYLPECSTHINVLDGAIEGIYGWLAINSLNGALDFPELHDHGKGHSTYGLLDMGGASTQVAFQPNSTEILEHQNNLFQLNLGELPVRDEKSYNTPVFTDYSLYSDSYLGFGMYRAHIRYLTSLVDEYKKEHNIFDDNGSYSKIRSPIPDPCHPIGYTYSAVIKDVTFDFTGKSDFKECMKSIFPVLSTSPYSSGTGDNKDCHNYDEEKKVSSCLLNDKIPAFDFEVNHFIGVSGYWDAITTLLSYEKDHKRKHKEDESEEVEASDKYDYKLIYQETSKVCSESFTSLIALNLAKKEKNQLEEAELANLCFKSSWILNFLHLGLGFPRFGIDENPNKSQQFKSLQLVEELEGSTFSWTLGRAILYANDEYIQAYNNYSIAKGASEATLKRTGFYHSTSSSVYHFGAEQNNIIPRPQFVEPRSDAKYHYYEYENADKGPNHESIWNIEPHRWYGIFIFMILIGFICWLMVGSDGRKLLVTNIKSQSSRVIQAMKRRFGRNRGRYTSLQTDTESNIELENIEANQFKIDSDEE